MDNTRELLRENYFLKNELKSIRIENDWLLKTIDNMQEENEILSSTNEKLLNSIKKIHEKYNASEHKIFNLKEENAELKEEIKELKNQIVYADECMEILVEENNQLCSLETFSSKMNNKEQHELEQATLLVDNLLEQLAKAEKEVLTRSHDKKQLQLLNERMNNCITLQSQEIFKLLK